MTQDRTAPRSGDGRVSQDKALASSHYGLLGVHPSASMREIRQAYRDLSKLYHPDTTALPPAIATSKFQQLNEAYATLASPERRAAYDRKIGYSRVAVVQPLPSLNRPQPRRSFSSAYLDPTDRPLSAGEVFALFILGLTFVACLILAIMIGMTRGFAVLQPATPPLIQPPLVLPEPPALVESSPVTVLPAPMANRLETQPQPALGVGQPAALPTVGTSSSELVPALTPDPDPISL